MELVVAVTPGIAGAPDAVAAAARAYGVELRPKYPGVDDAALSRWYSAPVTDEGEAGQVADALRAVAGVERVYVKGDARPAMLPPDPDVAIAHDNVVTPTPSFVWRQGYLGPAPFGISAAAAWQLPGGYGDAVHVADVELGFIPGHEALEGSRVSFVGPMHDGVGPRNHGASVLGVLAAAHGARGINGICPDATVSAVSFTGGDEFADDAVFTAAKLLGPGDVLLIELEQRTGIDDGSLDGYLPVEWWRDTFEAIRWATGRGIVVVEAAGNGSADLDAPPERDPHVADQPNPFLRGAGEDSGSIIVGAGAPPSVTGDPPDRSRLEFSNYGSCLDAQGWGGAVTTAGGYADGPGDLIAGNDDRRWYTGLFNGTSAAAPMVAAVLACVQSVLLRRGLRPLTPLEARRALRATGSPQIATFTAPLDQRIGSRPDLGQLIPYALSVAAGAPDEFDAKPRRRGMQFSIKFDRTGLEIRAGQATSAPPQDGDGASYIRVPSVDLPYVKGPTIAIVDSAGILRPVGSLDELAGEIAARLGPADHQEPSKQGPSGDGETPVPAEEPTAPPPPETKGGTSSA